MLKVYPAIFHNDDGSYWVEFPDLPGCQSCGDTLEETIDAASDALGLYLYSLKEDGRTPAPPSDIKELTADESSFVSLVTCDVAKYERNTKAVKKTLTIPQWLNEEAEKRHINFSSVLQDALIRQINS